MPKLTLENGALAVTRDASPRNVAMPLDALRIASLFVPQEWDCPLAETSARQGNQIDLNFILSAEQAQLAEWLAELDSDGAAQVLFFLEDYTGRYVTITLQDIRESEIDLLQELGERRRARRDKLADWSRNVPDLIVTGLDGDMVIFGPAGIRLGPDRFLLWEDVEGLEDREAPTGDSTTYRFVPRQGCPDSFTVRIPKRKARLFAAEYAFWRSLAARHAQSVV